MFGKHLKIVEQIIIVFIFAVIIPTTISGFIINNINQQSMRYQLRESAVLIANMVSDEIDFFNKTILSNLEQIVFTFEHLPNQKSKEQYLKEVKNQLDDCEELKIIDEKDLEALHKRNKQNKQASVILKKKRKPISYRNL